jgi:hypothetical protein
VAAVGPLPLLAHVEYAKHVEVAAGDFIPDLVFPDEYTPHLPIIEPRQALPESRMTWDSPDARDDRLHGPSGRGRIHGREEFVDALQVRIGGPGPLQGHGSPGALAAAPGLREPVRPRFDLGMLQQPSRRDLLERGPCLAVAFLGQADVGFDRLLYEPASRSVEATCEAVEPSRQLCGQMCRYDARRHDSINLNQID